MDRWTSISSLETASSDRSWPGNLEVNNKSNNAKDNNEINNPQRREQPSASESFRSMVQALGSEKMSQIRAIIAEHHHQAQSSYNNTGGVFQRRGSNPTSSMSGGIAPTPSDLNTMSSSGSTPASSSTDAALVFPDEVSLTIQHLESALGPEDMAELRESMILVRRQSIHLDVLISSDMTAEELERSVETVKTRQDEVLELIFVEIMDLIAAKLGIIDDSTSMSPAHMAGAQRDPDLLKVPELDSTGKSPSVTYNGRRSGGRQRQAQAKPKRPFEGYYIWKGTSSEPSKGKGKGMVDAAKLDLSGASKEEAMMEKKKKRRGCMGFCSMM